MIYKSYQVEQNINFIKEKLVLIYGENLSLIDDLKNEIKSKIIDVACYPSSAAFFVVGALITPLSNITLKDISHKCNR